MDGRSDGSLDNSSDNDLNIRTNCESNAILELNPNNDLQKFFEALDQKYYKRKLSESGVKAIWSNKMTKNFGSVHVSDDSNDIEIRLSRKLLQLSPRNELISILLKQMMKTFTIVSQNEIIESVSKINLNNNSNESINEFELKVREIEMQSEVDQRLETLDPKPDIHKLFRRLDKRYFDEVLHKSKIRVNWDLQLRSRPSITRPATDKKAIQIFVSKSVLKHRLRKDLVQTLLLEMISARLLLDAIDYNSDGHDIRFIEMMNELNRKSKADLKIDQKFALKWIS